MLWPRYTPMREAISGAKLILRAVHGDTSSRNEKSDILTSCLLIGGVLFRPLAIRHDGPPDHKGHNTPGVRKHQAPNGALRHSLENLLHKFHNCVRKHQAPNGALKPSEPKIVDRAALRWLESTERQTGSSELSVGEWVLLGGCG